MTDGTVCVHGLGHIGLPTAAMLAHQGYRVYGYDVDETVVRALERGQVQLEEPHLESFVSEVLESGALTPTSESRPAEYHLICVPTPLQREEKCADLSILESSVSTVRSELRGGDTVIVESTVPPGTTTETVEPMLGGSGLEAGSDYRLAYSPETILPGRVLTELRENDRLVGGIDEESTAAATALYESFVEGEIHRTRATVAEFAKLAQNTYRDANIALANDFARLARDLGVDGREAIALGNTHPRVDIHHPGPGVGGHCLPVDPWFLCEHTDRDTLIEHARRMNDEMVSYVATLVEAHLDDLAESRVAVLGLAYKGNVADTRHSPGVRLAEALRRRGVGSVRVHDPHVSVDELERDALTGSVEDGGLFADGGYSTVEDAASGADAIVLTTDHDEYRDLSPAALGRQMRSRVLVDTKDLLDHDQWEAAGFETSLI